MRCYLLVYPLIYTSLLRGASPLLRVVSCAWYRLISSCIVLWPAIGCTCLLVLSVVYRGRSCLLATLVAGLIVLWHLLQSVAVPARYSCRLSCRACSCGLVTSLLAVATAWHPHWYRQAVRYPTLRRGGGGFFKKCVGVDRNPPRPHFYARGRKKCDFQAQNRGNPRKKRVKILERLDEVKE